MEDNEVKGLNDESNISENLELQKDNTNLNTEEGKSSKKNNKTPLVLCLVLIILIVGIAGSIYLNKNKKETSTKVDSVSKNSAYRMTGNDLQKFDLYFMQLENEEKNKVYSPLSIKYALEMLAEGANGESKSQIDAVIGDYVAKKYINSKNMSFANAMFIKSSYKNAIKTSYAEKLQNKYNAEVIYDDFSNPANLNNWVKNKTLNLISDIFDDSIKDYNFFLTNALGIDMEWVNSIQGDTIDPRMYTVNYKRENFNRYIGILDVTDDYEQIKFGNNANKAKTVEIGAAINKYDIVKTLGEENIRKNITEKYNAWLKGEGAVCIDEETLNTKDFVDEYIKELDSNYKQVDSSTDFMLYDDSEVKTFAKDLKTYDGVTLQYVGIMPKTTSLQNFVKDIDSEKINKIISGLKEIKLENFKDGVVTEITAQIPVFKFNYDLDLKNDLQKLNITDVFDNTKADLSLISDDKNFIDYVRHASTIDFSNQGIKAAAVTVTGGLGDTEGCHFEYNYDVPIEKIDLTFDNPYMFLIRDKNSGEVWFAGTVYEPLTK